MTTVADPAARQRALDTGTPAWMVDLSVALGYDLESWHGVWKTTAPNPFYFKGDHVHVEEVVYSDETNANGVPLPVWGANDRPITRWATHRIPEGWTAVSAREARPVESQQ